MAAVLPNAGARPESGSLHAEQVYITHCTQADSFRAQAGFSIRASSTNDPELLKFAYEFPGYELPLDMWGSNSLPSQTPTRLALIPAPGNRQALIHTTFVQQDTRGRPGSYFTHMIFCQQLTLADALRSWGSPAWRRDYAQGATKNLPPLTELPGHGLINDSALQSFLKDGKSISKLKDLGVQMFPDRLQEDPQAARELLRMAMVGCIKALSPEAVAGGKRLYILAEPGLTALLLYGVLRLLPQGWVDRLTFSTYENSHATLRQFKSASVVCTYFKSTHKGLEADYANNRGFALDTFNRQKSSSDLQGAAPAVLKTLMDFAAEGQWDRLEDRLEYCDAEQPSLEALNAGQDLFEAATRLQDGRPTYDDLQMLRRSRRGRVILEQNEVNVWKFVKEASIGDKRVRDTYADLLRKHFNEVRGRVVSQLSSCSAQWVDHWDLTEHLLGGNKETRRQHFLEILRAAGEGPRKAPLNPLRLDLLRKWQLLHLKEDDLPDPIPALLACHTPEELRVLTQSGLPPAWLGGILFRALFRPETAALAAQTFRTPDGKYFPSFMQEMSRSPRDQQRRALDSLFAGSEVKAAPLFETLMRAEPLPADEVLDGFLSARKYDLVLDSSWADGPRLGWLLNRFWSLPKTRDRALEYLFKGIDRKLLLHDRQQLARLKTLQEARKAVGGDYPGPYEAKLNHWIALNGLFVNPNDTAPDPEAWQTSCKWLGVNSMEVLQEYFQNYVVQHEPKDSDVADRFANLFQTFYRRGESDEELKEMVSRWLEVIHGCSDRKRKSKYQYFLLSRFIPLEARLPLAKHFVKTGQMDADVYKQLEKNRTQEEAMKPVATAAVSGPPMDAGTQHEELEAPADDGAVYGPAVIERSRTFEEVSDRASRGSSRVFFLAVFIVLIILTAAGGYFWVTSRRGSNQESGEGGNKDRTAQKDDKGKKKDSEKDGDKVVSKDGGSGKPVKDNGAPSKPNPGTSEKLDLTSLEIAFVRQLILIMVDDIKDTMTVMKSLPDLDGNPTKDLDLAQKDLERIREGLDNQVVNNMRSFEEVKKLTDSAIQTIEMQWEKVGQCKSKMHETLNKGARDLTPEVRKDIKDFFLQLPNPDLFRQESLLRNTPIKPCYDVRINMHRLLASVIMYQIGQVWPSANKKLELLNDKDFAVVKSYMERFAKAEFDTELLTNSQEIVDAALECILDHVSFIRPGVAPGEDDKRKSRMLLADFLRKAGGHLAKLEKKLPDAEIKRREAAFDRFIKALSDSGGTGSGDTKDKPEKYQGSSVALLAMLIKSDLHRAEKGLESALVREVMNEQSNLLAKQQEALHRMIQELEAIKEPSATSQRGKKMPLLIEACKGAMATKNKATIELLGKLKRYSRGKGGTYLFLETILWYIASDPNFVQPFLGLQPILRDDTPSGKAQAFNAQMFIVAALMYEVKENTDLETIAWATLWGYFFHFINANDPKKLASNPVSKEHFEKIMMEITKYLADGTSRPKSGGDSKKVVEAKRRLRDLLKAISKVPPCGDAEPFINKHLREE